MSATTHDVILEASKHKGYHEGKTSGGVWDNTQKFGARYGWNGVAWCQIFIWCIFQDAGAGSLVPKTASCANGYDWFAARKRTGRSPKVGALIYFGPDAGNHVGLVTSYTSKTVTYISGNTSDHPDGPANSVQEKTINRSGTGVYGYTYPAYTPAKPPTLPKPPGAVRRVLTVRKGQTLGGIAAAAGLSLAALLVLNPGYKSHPDLIHPGDKVTVPAAPAKK